MCDSLLTFAKKYYQGYYDIREKRERRENEKNLSNLDFHYITVYYKVAGYIETCLKLITITTNSVLVNSQSYCN
jgi:hypothetical protein